MTAILKTRALNSWGLFAIVVVPMSLAVAWAMTRSDLASAEVVSSLITFSVRLAVPWLFVAFAASSLFVLFPGEASRWLLRNRRIFGLCFAAGMGWQLLFIVWLVGWHFAYYMVTAYYFLSLVEQVPGYVFLIAMTITSFRPGRQLLSARQWKLLHKTGIYFIWFVVWTTYWFELFYYDDIQIIDYVYYWAGFLRLGIAGWRPGPRSACPGRQPRSRVIHFDALVIGAGHNGLTCAAYLAKAGLKVKILERRTVVGGAAVTEEFCPGFKNSVYSYAISLLNPKIIRDLELEKHGLTIIEKPAGTLSLLGDDHLQLTRDGQQVKREVARFSHRDASRVHAFDEEIARVALAVRGIAMSAPPDIGGGWRELLSLMSAGNTLRKLDSADQAVLAQLMTKSLGDYLDSWFEGDALKGVWGFEGVIGNFADPYQPGTAYVLLHHAFGEVNGKTGVWGIARGGMGAISQAMLSFANTKGVEVETGAGVAEVLVDRGKAAGVVTDDGRKIRARVVAANVHPQTLLLRLLDPSLLDDASRRRIESYRSESGSFRMNLALSELPRFSSVKADDDFHFKGTVEVSPSLEYLSSAYMDAKARGWSQRPIIALQIPSTQDDTLCPSGSHVASLFCQHFRRHLPDGRSWDEVKDEVRPRSGHLGHARRRPPRRAGAAGARQPRHPAKGRRRRPPGQRPVGGHRRTPAARDAHRHGPRLRREASARPASMCAPRRPTCLRRATAPATVHCGCSPSAPMPPSRRHRHQGGAADLRKTLG